jgi:hypothetical protein
MEVPMRLFLSRSLVLSVFVLLSSGASAEAQSIIPISTFLRQTKATFLPITRSVDLSGPRFGITQLSPEIVDKLKERNIEVSPTISQFGWQFERQFYSREGGVTVVNEWVVLLGGLDQSVVLPSVSWLVGFRTKEGAEFGIGPNITPAGVALAIAAGVSFRAGPFNVPVNFALVPSRYGTRFSVLTGFNMRR